MRFNKMLALIFVMMILLSTTILMQTADYVDFNVNSGHFDSGFCIGSQIDATLDMTFKDVDFSNAGTDFDMVAWLVYDANERFVDGFIDVVFTGQESINYQDFIIINDMTKRPITVEVYDINANYEFVGGGAIHSRTIDPATFVPSCASFGLSASTPADVVTLLNKKNSNNKSNSDEANTANTDNSLAATTSNCGNLSGSVQVNVPSTLQATGMIQCNEINAAGVGMQSVLDQGFINGVDLWGPFQSPVEVCLEGNGGLLYIDTMTSPRTISWASTFTRGNHNCTTVSHAGTVIMVANTGSPNIVSAANPTDVATSDSVAIQSIALSNCRVTTQAILNFRSEPSNNSDVMSLVPYDITLDAINYVIGWYNVIYGDNNGWLSDSYLEPHGSCN